MLRKQAPLKKFLNISRSILGEGKHIKKRSLIFCQNVN